MVNTLSDSHYNTILASHATWCPVLWYTKGRPIQWNRHVADHKSIQWLLYVHYNDAVGADGYKSVNFESFSVAQYISIAIILYNL